MQAFNYYFAEQVYGSVWLSYSKATTYKLKYLVSLQFALIAHYQTKPKAFDDYNFLFDS